MKCPKCDNKKFLRDGIVNNKQRFYCKLCNYHYTVSQRKQKPLSYKRIALALHIIGLSNRKIKQVIGVSDVSIMNWINKYGMEPEQIRDTSIKVQILKVADLGKVIKDSDKLLLINVYNGSNDIYKIEI
jgi:transposase-like protein